jgi:hypothetical protein
VPRGKLTGPIEVPTKIYPDVKANVWFYVPAQWDGVTPLAVQVWGDGQNFTGPRPGQWRVLDTLDNLTAQRRIPLMVSIFVQPGTGLERNQRSLEYDTASNSYLHRLLDEIFPVVAMHVKMRADGYSRAIQGLSSAANVGMANGLRFKGYDYHFSFGVGEHNNAHGAAELPEALTWLWRDYDPARKSQEFVQEPAEKDQPVWRVVQLNRR